MSVLGWILAVFGLAGVVFALRMMLKAKKMQAVPFKTPGEIARDGAAAADQKGLVSTEGPAQPIEPLTAPMSGQPCLAYELLIERKWEKETVTERGTEKKTGSDKIFDQYRGSVFQIGDSAGSVQVDATKRPDADFEKSHSSTVRVGMMIPGTLAFGQMQLNTPALSRDARTVSFVGTEKILKPGNLYALGALQGNTIVEPPGALAGKLTLSSKGRAKLLSSTKRNMILGYAIGGVLVLGGVPLGIFGPSPKSNGCKDFVGTTACNGRMTARDGIDYKWTVPADGTYKVSVKQPKVKYPIDGTLTIFDEKGQQVAYNDGGEPGKNAEVSQKFAAGTYRINVRDFARSTISGGYSFNLEVAPVAEELPKVAAAAIAPAEGSEACEKAVACCTALSGKDPSSCGALRNATDATCESTLKSYRKAAKHNKAARAACE